MKNPLTFEAEYFRVLNFNKGKKCKFIFQFVSNGNFCLNIFYVSLRSLILTKAIRDMERIIRVENRIEKSLSTKNTVPIRIKMLN